jgi:hypothetical protein
MSEIRSVSVHLDADVASYIAKMRLAGAETDKAFSSSSRSIDTTNSKLGETEAVLGKVDTQARRVETSMARVGTTTRRVGENDFSRATSRVDGFLGKLGLVPALAVTAGAALVPLGAAAVGVAAAFAAPIAFVGGGLTLFGLLGGAAIASTQKQFKSIDTLSKAVDSAKLSLDQATRSAGKNASTSTSVANAQDRLSKATKDYHAALQALSPQQRAFHNSLEGLQSDFAKFIRGPAGQDLLGPFTKGLQVADDLLPKSRPIIHAVAGDLDQLLGELDKYANTPGFDRFVHQVADQIGPDLLQFGHIVGDVGPGIGHLLLLLGKRLSPELMHEVGQLGQDFNHWATSKGARHDVESFIRYFHEVGPDAAHTIAAVARALGHTVDALAPLGPPVLHVVKGIADAISGVPIPVLTALAGTAASLVAFQKVGGFKALSLGGKLLGGGKVNPLTGGPAGVLGGLTGKGVVPVYVTNKGFGGPGGMPGEPGVVGKIGKYFGFPAGAAAEGATGLSAAAVAALAIPAAAIVYAGFIQRNIMPYGPNHATDPNVARGGPAALAHYGLTPTPAPSAPTPEGFRGPAQALKFYNDLHKAVTSMATPMDSLHARLGKASQDLELVGHSADRAFGGGAKQVEQLGGQLNAIKGGPAAQQLELIGTAADRGFTTARAGADQLQGHIDSLHGKQLDVTVNGGQSLATLRAIASQEAALRNKTISITTVHVSGGSSLGGNADGGTIPGPRSPYGDKVLRYLAPGEEVISNRRGQADRHRPLLRKINAGGMANGGTVGSDFTGVAVTPGQPITNHIARVTAELHRLQYALKLSTSELDDERSHRQALAQQRQQLVQTVKSGFMTDIFGTSYPDNGIWSNGPVGLKDPNKILHQDIRDAREYRDDLRKLKRRGLHGGALAQVTTLDAAQQALGMSPHELRETTRLFRIRNRVAQAAGADLGNDIYGKRIDESNRHLSKIRDHVQETNRRIHDLTQEVKHLRHERAVDHAKRVKEAAKNADAVGTAVGKQINHSAATAAKRRAPR